MTSHRCNARRAAAQAEMEIFDRLPPAIRDAINEARGSVKASSALNALLRGVPEELIVKTIRESEYRHTKEPTRSQNNA